MSRTWQQGVMSRSDPGPRATRAARRSGSARRGALALARWGSAIATVTMLLACQRQADMPALPPAQLHATQTQALQQMNAAGATAFAGWTWRYEFGAGCRLRVIKQYEGRPIPVNEYVLADHEIELVPYPGSGFGVKGYPRGRPGSADLFDARTEAHAESFAAQVRQLLTACNDPLSAPR